MKRHRVPARLVGPSLGLILSMAACIVAASPLANPVRLASSASIREAGRPTNATVGPRPERAEQQRVTIAADPFRPDRGPPGTLAWMEDAGTGASEQRGPELPLLLIGTAVSPNGGGFAMCKVGAEPARVVRLGETYAGYTLSEVAQGRATFRTETGDQVELHVSRMGS